MLFFGLILCQKNVKIKRIQNTVKDETHETPLRYRSQLMALAAVDWQAASRASVNVEGMSRLFWISRAHLLKSYNVSDVYKIPKIIQNLRRQNYRLCRMLLLWPLHGTRLHQPGGVIALGEQGAKVQDEEVYLIYSIREFLPVFWWLWFWLD